MGFCYFSLFSLVPLGIAYGVLALIFVGVVLATRGTRARALIRTVAGVAFIFLPLSEELWIARNFAQACKEAGTFIYGKVHVEGFYDATMPSAIENIVSGRYWFIEQASEDGKGFERVERGSDELRGKALSWYAEGNPGKGRPESRSIIYPLNENERIVVSPNGMDAWRVTKLDQPTARHHFRNADPVDGTPWGYKIVRSGSVVIDTESREEIARYAGFGRRPPWFFIGLGVAPFACDSPGDWPNTRSSGLVYRDALVPASQR
jgi:hypothetical protein